MERPASSTIFSKIQNFEKERERAGENTDKNVKRTNVFDRYFIKKFVKTPETSMFLAKLSKY